jgi:hypothetical protein
LSAHGWKIKKCLDERPKSPNQLYAFQGKFDRKKENLYNYWVDKMISWAESKGAKIQDDEFMQSTFYGGSTV